MVTLHIDDDAYAELARRAESHGITVEEWVNRTYAGKPSEPPPPPSGESAYDAFLRVGAIGCINGGPTDIATNPRHMEGFGKS